MARSRMRMNRNPDDPYGMEASGSLNEARWALSRNDLATASGMCLNAVYLIGRSVERSGDELEGQQFLQEAANIMNDIHYRIHTGQ